MTRPSAMPEFSGVATNRARRQPTKGLIAAVMFLACAMVLQYWVREPAPTIEPWGHEMIGTVMAERAVKLLGPGGTITLIAPDTKVFPSLAADVQREHFHKTLERLKASVVATNLVQLDPGRVIRVPAGDFFEILRRRTNSDVVVSFMGPPVLSEEQRARLPEKPARVVALCSGWMPRQVDLRSLFSQDLLHAAVLSRIPPAGPTPRTRNSRDWFDHLYKVVDANQVSDIPPYAPRKAP